MTPAVVVVADPERRCALPLGLPVPLCDGLTFGRGDGDIVIADDRVARRDVVIVADGAGFALEQHGPVNRARGDGRAWRDGPVVVGDAIVFFDLDVRVVDLDDLALVDGAPRGDGGGWFIPAAHAALPSSIAWSWAGGALREGFVHARGVVEVADPWVLLSRVAAAVFGRVLWRLIGEVAAVACDVDRACFGVDFAGRVVAFPGNGLTLQRLRALVDRLDGPQRAELNAALEAGGPRRLTRLRHVGVDDEEVAVVVRGLFADEHRAARLRREQLALLDEATVAARLRKRATAVTPAGPTP